MFPETPLAGDRPLQGLEVGASVPCSRESRAAITRCFWVLPRGTGSPSSVFHVEPCPAPQLGGH